ncbi:MAG: nucleotidyltransferase [Saprospiraceae bacterium]|uniref:nucleotidyltransferase n=1 Tax=Candidatus Brachybacter algidus TaxID=2982024 RepID=UPI00257EAD79|nr:nucleotidyltransferase [Candidatus Brachybacter algidus]MBK7603818.1 nucleotidyltransferase [Candidatus Brachybacter algidus]
MNLFIDKHIEIIKQLLSSDVDFIIIGGYSVIFHGYKRTTGDLDIWLKPDNLNRDKFIHILRNNNFEDGQIDALSELDFSNHLLISMGEEPEKIDFITIINSVSFEEANSMKIFAEFEGLKIPFLHLNHLILSKMNTGRSKDKTDIEELQRIKNISNK